MPVSIDVLINDSDPDGDLLTITDAGLPINGWTTINTGFIDYTPNPGYFGPDSFTYTIDDGNGGTSMAMVTIDVMAGAGSGNTAPFAVDDFYSIPHDTALDEFAPGVLGNDWDMEADPLTVSLVTDVTNGVLTLNPDGSFLYVPNSSFAGSDFFTYSVNDGVDNSNIATVTLDVTNTAPFAVDDFYSVNNDLTLNIDAAGGVLSTDWDMEGDSLSAILDLGPTNGMVTLNPDGSFSYTPNVGFVGTDFFTYFASDGIAQSPAAMVTVDVVGPPTTGLDAVDDGPDDYTEITCSFDDSNDHFTTDEDSSFTTGNVLANDSGDLITISSIDTTVTLGIVANNGDGTFDYDPNAAFDFLISGESATDTFQYTIVDSAGATGTATVTITIFGTLRFGDNSGPPVIAPATFSINENAGQGDLVSILSATDPDGDELVYSIVGQAAYDSATATFIEPWGGAIERPFTIDPETGELRTSDATDAWQLDFEDYESYQLTIRASDRLASADALITVDINDVADAPTAVRLNTVYVVSTVADGTDLVTFLSSDQDSDPTLGSSSHIWSLTGDPGPFSLDASTGALSTASALIDGATYNIQAQVIDGGGISITSDLEVQVVDTVVASASGGGFEGGMLDFIVDVQIPIGMNDIISTIEIDIDNDGSYELSAPFDSGYGGAQIFDVDQLNLLGSTVDEGTFPAKFRLTWQDLTQAEYPFNITIENAEPTVDLTVAASGSAGSPVTVTIATSDPGPDTITSLQLDWGDGTVESVASTGGSFAHTYSRLGDYQIQVQATDEDGTVTTIEWVSVDAAFSPVITSSTFSLAAVNQADLWITAETFDAFPFDSNSIDVNWDTNLDGLFDDGTGTSEVVLATCEGVFHAAVSIVDPVNGSETIAYFEFTGEGSVLGTPKAVDPALAGEGELAVPESIQLIQSYFKVFFGEEGMNLLKAFHRAGGTIEQVSQFSTLWYEWDFDYWPLMRIQLDDDLDPATAAMHLMRGLDEASAYAIVRNQLVAMLNVDPSDETLWQQVRDSYKASIKTGAQTAATFAELYVEGVTVFSSGADFVVSVAQGSEALRGGNKLMALAAVIPLVPASVVKSGGRYIIKTVDGATTAIKKITPAYRQQLEWAIEYAKLVNADTFKKWDAQLPAVPVNQQEAVRKIAKELELIPHVPINKVNGKRFADFSSVAFEIPGVAAPYSVTLNLPSLVDSASPYVMIV